MIKTILFDFGDVFLNLDKKGAARHAREIFGIDSFTDAMLAHNALYEKGRISTAVFLNYYQKSFPHISMEKLIETWNIILRDFPLTRLEFLKQLSAENKYMLILLSNTNELHIDWVKAHVPFYEDFRDCFHQFYLSHEIHLRKPEPDIFNFVVQKNELKANEILFVDDTLEHTMAAEKLGFHTWNIDPSTEDITKLFSVNASLF
jgi:putative hydrolase of the HAD superfamily